MRSMLAKPLVQFDAHYYKYPRSVSRGFWGRYPVEAGLTVDERVERGQWLARVKHLSSTEFHQRIKDVFADPSDDVLLQSLLATHGIFAERFFQRSVRDRVTRNFEDAHLD